MLETKTLTSATSSPSMRSTASTTLSCTRSATSRRAAVALAVRNTARWIWRCPSTETRTPRWAVSRLIQSPKCRALASSRPATPSISRAAMLAMLPITSLATRTVPMGWAACMGAMLLRGLPLPGLNLRAPPSQGGIGPAGYSIHGLAGRCALARPLLVRARAGVHPDAVALVHEQRHLHRGARLQRRRLRRARHRVAAVARVRVRDLQLHRDRKLHADHRVLVLEDVDGVALLEIRQDVHQPAAVERQLLVRGRVHEVVDVAVAVQVRRLRLLDAGGLVLLAAAEALLEDRAALHVAQLRLDDGASPSELDVLEVDDREQLPVHLEHGADSEIIRLDQSSTPSRRGSPAVRGRRSPPPPPG